MRATGRRGGRSRSRPSGRTCRRSRVTEDVGVRPFLARLDAHVVRPRQQRRAQRLVHRARGLARMEHDADLVLDEEVGVRILAAKTQHHLLRLAQLEAVVVDAVALAIHAPPREPRPLATGNVPEVGRPPRHRIRVRLRPVRRGRLRPGDIAHRDEVAATRHMEPGRLDVVRPRLRRRERHPAVVALAAVVVEDVPDGRPIPIVEPAQDRVDQRPVARRAALEVDGVGPPRHQLHGEPVAVVTGLDLTDGARADDDGTFGFDAGRIIVDHAPIPSTQAADTRLTSAPGSLATRAPGYMPSSTTECS